MKNSMLKGKTLATFTPRSIIENEGGEVRKYLSSDSANSKFFKEIYFSRLLPGKSKKWKCNKNQTQNLSVATGRISVICIQKNVDIYVYEEFLIDDRNFFGVLEIPPGIIYGLFTDTGGAVVVNALEEPYSDSDRQQISVHLNLVPALL